jgi:endonuclease/exonuclease/phosphatase (EEP) superfamily protein YafD
VASTLADLLGQPEWAARLERKIGLIMATVAEALQGWRAYTDALKAQVADLAEQLEVAQTTVQQLIDTDAAEDAAQAAALTEQIAQQISDALASAQAVPEVPEPEPPIEPVPEPEAPSEGLGSAPANP